MTLPTIRSLQTSRVPTYLGTCLVLAESDVLADYGGLRVLKRVSRVRAVAGARDTHLCHDCFLLLFVNELNPTDSHQMRFRGYQ